MNPDSIRSGFFGNVRSFVYEISVKADLGLRT
jgi:hypothetical protein